MSKRKASELLPLVNDPESIRLLTLYLDYRIEHCRTELETAESMSRISELQGSIKELKKLKRIKDVVEDMVKSDYEI